MKFDFTGAGVALITPFRENNEIDFNALEAIIERQIAGGIDYLVALGTTAETPTLSEEEKNEVVEFVRVKTAGRIPIVVGMGGNDTNSMVKRIASSVFDGISGLLTVTPYYNRPGQEGLYRHFRELAEVSPVPLILYNVPARTGVNLEAETVIRLAESSANIAAVKEASGSIAQMTRIIRDAPAGFSVVSGDDVMALPLISVGGKGVISVIANALPGKMSQLIHSALAGDFPTAAILHREMSELFRLQFQDGNPAGVKVMLACMGLISNHLRLPLTPATSKTKEQIEAELSKILS
jgi:4-hydroxy-tetrahydrodipicolinate synthase